MTLVTYDCGCSIISEQPDAPACCPDHHDDVGHRDNVVGWAPGFYDSRMLRIDTWPPAPTTPAEQLELFSVA